MIRKLINLVVFLLIANALYRVAPVWWHYREFKDGVEELTLFSRDRPIPAIVDAVMRLAAEHHVPLDRDYVQVQKDMNGVYIDASYVEVLKLAPGYEIPHQFDVGPAERHVKIPVAGARK
jgi:hypothetical protein